MAAKKQVVKKDLFSAQAAAYARYRPTYPPELFAYILSFVKERGAAWDCATGNGQAAVALANYFHRVEATDSSQAQLKKAIQKPNITYRLSPAEQTPFAEDEFDLVTVATAYHWLDRLAFQKEAHRVGKPGAVVAVWAYNLLQGKDRRINEAIQRFYKEVIYAFWDSQRRLVENGYQTAAFDFSPLPAKDFVIHCHWTKKELLGYVSSWSSVQQYKAANGHSPLPLLEEMLPVSWYDEEQQHFQFPLFLKIGRITK